MAKSSRPDRKRGDRRDHKREPSEYEEMTLSVDRVTRVVKGGRRLRFRAIVVVGNKKGKVGLGTGKATEVQASVKKATRAAKRAMMVVPMVGHTIPHEVNVKHKAAKLRLMPASPGTGLVAGGPLRVILDLAGVKDVLAKRFGTGNKLVNAQAAMLALKTLRPVSRPVEQPKVPTVVSAVSGHPEETLPIKQVQLTEEHAKELGSGPQG